MAHQHDHDLHGHRHVRDPAGSQRSLVLVLLLSGVYMLAEAVGGWLTNSLALLADASHMLSDVAALALTLFAGWISRRPPSPRRTYGYYRAEILAALLNGALLVAIAILIVFEGLQRLRAQPEVAGLPMLAIASGGLLVNLASLWILRGVREHSLNLQGAWLHVMADALGSVGAIAAGLSIWTLGWRWADPVASVVIALLVVWSSWALLRQSLNVLMEGAPHGLDVDRVRDAMAAMAGVQAVHDLHVWSITSGVEALSAHVVVPRSVVHEELLGELSAMLERQFHIGHITVQVEHEACALTAHEH